MSPWQGDDDHDNLSESEDFGVQNTMMTAVYAKEDAKKQKE